MKIKLDKYEDEVKGKYGNTKSYKEYEKKQYKKEQIEKLKNDFKDIFMHFNFCMTLGYKPDSNQALDLVRVLQKHINDNYYNCDLNALAGLGKLYVEDERFTKWINEAGVGTAEYVSKAINDYVLRENNNN